MGKAKKGHWAAKKKAPLQALLIYTAYLEVEGHKKSDKESAGAALLQALERHVKLLTYF